MSTRTRKLESPFNYPGGKSRLAPLILDEIKPALTDNLIYVEPFVGGGSLLCALASRQIPQKIIVNDIDPAVASFWRCLTDPGMTRRLVERIEATINLSNSDLLCEFERTKPLLDSGNTVVAGYAAILRNRTSYGGMLGRGTPQGGMDQKNESFNINSLYSPIEIIRRIFALHEAIGSVLEVHNEDFGAIIQKYDQPGTLFYCDPPFLERGNMFRNNMEDDADHIRLAETIHGVKHALVAVSYCDHPWVSRLLYHWADFKKLEVSYSVGGFAKREKQFELLIVNRPPSGIEPPTASYWDLVAMEFAKAEGLIEHHEQMFRQVGLALRDIRDLRLYKTPDNMTRTFAEYCHDERAGGRDYAYKLIRAAEAALAVDKLSFSTQKPIKEAQVRPLALLKEPEQQARAWDIAVAKAIKKGKRVTGLDVGMVVQKMLLSKGKRKSRQILKFPGPKQIVSRHASHIGEALTTIGVMSSDLQELLDGKRPMQYDLNDLEKYSEMASELSEALGDIAVKLARHKKPLEGEMVVPQKQLSV